MRCSCFLIFVFNLFKFQSSEWTTLPNILHRLDSCQLLNKEKHHVRAQANELRGGCLDFDQEGKRPFAEKTLDWKEVSDISGDNLWESKICHSFPNGAWDVSLGQLRSWDLLIPRQHETILGAIAAQRFQDARAVFQERHLHVHPGSEHTCHIGTIVTSRGEPKAESQDLSYLPNRCIPHPDL